MTTLSDTAIRELLIAIFPERPAPPVVMENKRDGYRTGCVDFNEYSVKTIRIWAYFMGSERSLASQERTLAHELGHIIHGGHYGPDDECFQECEAAADYWRDVLLSELDQIARIGGSV